MARKKNTEVEKQLKSIELTPTEESQTKREDEVIDLLKQLVSQNEKVIKLIEILKDRFV